MEQMLDPISATTNLPVLVCLVIRSSDQGRDELVKIQTILKSA